MLGLPLGCESVFMLELARWMELERLWSAAEPLPVGLVCSCSPVLINTMVEAQVNQGWGQKQSTQKLVVGGGNT